ncbi:protein kinase [Nonomuraea sp. NPDC048826]|uniref:protein kinase domain-containing protein n=1 Tax=Nonomuraea sp. NPDC048826 TaxID=3364347 RepID=UPI003720C8CA
MTTIAPLRPGDPPRLGGLELSGRLGAGGQGVVYLATDHSGARVAVKWLRPDLSGDQTSVARFLREVEVARQVAPFCTAAVLGTGVEHDRPYIVSEYVEGRPLSATVQADGPRTGTALHRLAIGTATALAAIHQAGIVHRDFKPANVLLGADGPRVIDFGIARALDATSTISASLVGTPAYMAPEQVEGHQVGPAADMFAWAGTMIYAATGKAPFGSDTVPAVINRVLTQTPDLTGLDGPLREVVAACLDKDPARRPTAEEVLMRLLRHPGAASGILAQGSTASAPARKRRRTALIAGAAVAGALLLVAGVLVARPGDESPTASRSQASARATAAGQPTGQPTGQPAEQPTVPPTGSPSELPGGAITVFEHPDDPIRLTSYEIYDKKRKEWVPYARESLGGDFVKHSGAREALVSPDGRYLATRGDDYSANDRDLIEIVDRRDGGRKTVETIGSPLQASIDAWTPDSGKILLSIQKGAGQKGMYVGFVMVHAATGQVEVARTGSDEYENTFGWDDRRQGVVNEAGTKGLRFLDASGKVVRELRSTGVLGAGTDALFSPSGKALVTDCLDKKQGDHCVWDARTGALSHSFTSPCDNLLGWYGERHFYCWIGDDIRVADFRGTLGRTLVRTASEVRMAPIFTPVPA